MSFEKEFLGENLNNSSKKIGPIKIGKKTAQLNILQGGMGIGISNYRLSGAVAREGGIGTLSSAGICMLPQYKHLLDHAITEAKKIQNPLPIEIRQEIFDEVNLDCIKKEIKNAKLLANGNGLIFMNFLFALKTFKNQVIAACEEGIDGITCGAGIAWNLPEITKNFPDVSLGIMLSDPKGVKIIIEKRQKTYGRIPDYIIFEDPGKAGGHLGARNIEKVDDPKLSLSSSLPIARKWLDENGYKVPIIGAGGIINHSDIIKTLNYGADGVQLGTRFLASEESGAHSNFKQAVVDSTKDDIVTYMSSVGLPARALKNSPILDTMKGLIAKQRKCVKDCLNFCGWRDGDQETAQMCIMEQLVKSTKGSKGGGLMFVGTSAADIKDILTVKEIMNQLKGEK